MQSYQFQSIQQHVQMDGQGRVKRITEGVALRNGQGIKAVEVQQNNDIRRAMRPLTTPEVSNIQARQFMPNLFKDCHGDCSKQKPKKITTRKGRKKVKKTKKQKRGSSK